MNPPDFTSGLGETVRAHRLYTGLSREGFAKACGLGRVESLKDIETERRRAPAGFLDTVAEVVDRFDAEVDDEIKMAELNGVTPVLREVSDHPMREWHRAVVSRACVVSKAITPVLSLSLRARDAG